MRNKRLWFILISFVMICLSIIALKFGDEPITIVKSVDTVRVEGEVKFFSDFGAENFTCTGLAWDEKDGSFWIGDYGTVTSTEQPFPRVVEVSADFEEVLRVVELSNVLTTKDKLQGVAYDKLTDSLWLAVGKKVKNINKNGDLLSEFSLGKYSRYKANGICVDDSDDSLWVLCYSKYLLNFKKTGELIKVLDCYFQDQDHIVSYGDNLFVTVGADYDGEENYVISIHKSNGNVKVEYQIVGACSIEGISIVADKMYIANDGLYHNARIKESYISVIDFR